MFFYYMDNFLENSPRNINIAKTAMTFVFSTNSNDRSKKRDILYTDNRPKLTRKCLVVSSSNHIHKKICKVNRTDFKG